MKQTLAIIGILLIIGACGKSDFADEIGATVTMAEILKPMVWGVGCIVCSAFIPSEKGEY